MKQQWNMIHSLIITLTSNNDLKVALSTTQIVRIGFKELNSKLIMHTAFSLEVLQTATWTP